MTAGLVIVFLGVLLVDAAIRGVKPWSPILEAFGAPPSPAQTYPTLPPGGQTGGAGTAGEQHGQGQVSGGTGITQACATFEAAVRERFPRLRFDGDFNCRKIIPHNGGTSSAWSQHAWGNAVDYTGTAKDMAQLVVWANANRGRFHIANVIPPGSAVNAVHVDFIPTHTGTPPCAPGGA